MSIDSRSRQYGVVFDHWQIKEFLGSGSGGKSAVFSLGRMDSAWGKSALKVINLIEEKGDIDTLSPQRRNAYEQVKNECRQSAEQEVRLMDQMHGNTNIVDYLDHKYVNWSDETGFGCDMLIRMELLEDLRGKLRQGYLYPEEGILKIGRDICTALVLCHRKGILHRDIKPENIFINSDGNYKLGDFGVSRILSNAPTAVASTGIGTPEYAAPEQYSGHHDKRVDIYSLGLVLYELSNANRLPFASTVYVRPGDIARRQCGEALPAPQNASPDFAAVILKACAYDPENRYRTAEEFLAALNSLSTPVSCPAAAFHDSNHETRPAQPASTQSYATVPAQPVAEWNYSTAPAQPSRMQSSVTAPAQPKHDAPPSRTEQTHKPYLLIAGILALAAVVMALLFLLISRREPAETSGQTNAPASTDGGSVSENEHIHTWQNATCTAPKVCSTCAITEGSALGHDWMAATTSAPKTCRACGATEGTPLRNISVGDVLTMGYYGNESIEWIVLEYDSATGQALLISKYCLDAVPFHSGGGSGTWETSSIRKWLNNAFISAAFTQQESDSILTKTISTPQNPDFGTDSGRDTQDRVFLLSYEEAVYYFPSQTSRQGIPTAYCQAQGCYDPVRYAQENGTTYAPEEAGYTWWWLRTAGKDGKRVCNVVAKGTASTYGAYKTSNEGTIRPAMWVQLG